MNNLDTDGACVVYTTHSVTPEPAACNLLKLKKKAENCRHVLMGLFWCPFNRIVLQAGVLQGVASSLHPLPHDSKEQPQETTTRNKHFMFCFAHCAPCRCTPAPNFGRRGLLMAASPKPILWPGAPRRCLAVRATREQVNPWKRAKMGQKRARTSPPPPPPCSMRTSLTIVHASGTYFLIILGPNCSSKLAKFSPATGFHSLKTFILGAS